MVYNTRLMNGYHSWLNRVMRPRTVPQYMNTAIKFNAYVGKPFEQVDIIDVTEFLDVLESKYPASTVQVYSQHLKSLLKFTGKSDLAMQMPVPKHPVHSIEKEIEKIQWMPEEMVQQLIDSAVSMVDKAVLQMGFHFALRVGEASLLNRSWIDKKHNTMKIYRLKTSFPWMELPFDHSDTDIHDTRQVLSSYLTGYRHDDSDAMFLAGKFNHNRYERISHDTLGRIFKKTLRKASIEHKKTFNDLVATGASFHCLRHSKATNIVLHQIEHGKPPSLLSVARWLGHKNINNAMIYVHLAAKYLGKKDISEVV